VGYTMQNKHNLPESYVKLIEHWTQNYSNGGSDFSVTELIDSPRIVQLKKRNDQLANNIDVADMYFSLLGNIAHKSLEGCAPEGALCEERLSVEYGGAVVSGQVDMYKDKTITDYKLTGVYSLSKKPFGDWFKQLNMYAHLFRRHGYEVERLEIFAMLRDWKIRDAAKNKEYPQTGVVLIPIKLLSPEDAEEFFNSRCDAHIAAAALPDDDLPMCNTEERWATPDSWTVLKRGNKRGVRFNSLGEARSFASGLGACSIKKNSGYNLRCKEFCPVSTVCKYGV